MLKYSLFTILISVFFSVTLFANQTVPVDYMQVLLNIKQDPTALTASLSHDKKLLRVSVADTGVNRIRYAMQVCDVISKKGMTDTYIRILDHAKVKSLNYTIEQSTVGYFNC